MGIITYRANRCRSSCSGQNQFDHYLIKKFLHIFTNNKINVINNYMLCTYDLLTKCKHEKCIFCQFSSRILDLSWPLVVKCFSFAVRQWLQWWWTQTYTQPCIMLIALTHWWVPPNKTSGSPHVSSLDLNHGWWSRGVVVHIN